MTEIDIQNKIQQLELDTVKAVTELKAEVKSLAKEVNNLAGTINKMTENYVTREEYSKDMTAMSRDLAVAKRVGIVRSIMVGVLTTVATAVITFEIMRNIKG